MREVTAKEANIFIKNITAPGKPRTTLRKCIDAMNVGQKMLFTKNQDFPKKDYRQLYYMCKDEERKVGKKFLIHPNQTKNEVLVERLK